MSGGARVPIGGWRQGWRPRQPARSALRILSILSIRAAWPALPVLLALAGCTGPGARTERPEWTSTQAALASLAVMPEPASPYRPGLRPVQAGRQMVVTAHPLATQAGLAVLRGGGSAADAAIAVQAVLGLVEPQSSGLGGGAFIVHYDAARRAVQTYDGRETAPAAATPDDLRWVGPEDRRPPQPSVRASGRAIGTPGVLRALELLHADHGRRPWSGLFEPAIAQAEQGFRIGGRLSDALTAAAPQLRLDAEAAAYFLQSDGRPRPRGELLRNPDYALTLRAIAQGGADAFYRGPIAADIVAEIGRIVADVGTATDAGTVGIPTASSSSAPAPVPAPVSALLAITPGRTTLQDLADYRAVRRAPVCIDLRAHRVCGMGPPSSGGIAVAQILGVLSHFDLPALPPLDRDVHGGRPDPRAVHLITEAQRLAYADRNAWVADTDHVPLPGAGVAALLDPAYLRQRAALIRADRSLGTAPAGEFPGVQARGVHAGEGVGTSHVSIVDDAGNAVSMTTTIESSLGSYRLVRGFLLNNQLTDFSAEPTDARGPVANRVGPRKRPRSSMAPTVVLDLAPDGTVAGLHAVTGSPGGAAIIQFVGRQLIGLLDWGLDAQQAAGLPHFGAFNGPATVLGSEHPTWVPAPGSTPGSPAAPTPGADPGAESLAQALRARGHQVQRAPSSSGVATIVRRVGPDGRPVWQGGVDPRREGLAAGD